MTFYRQLLESTASQREELLQTPVITECLAGNITLDIYRAFLHEAYHHVKHTVPLLMACGARIPERQEWMREAIAEYIEEETGHQEWILNDLAATGADPDRTRNGKPSQATDVMVAYAWDTVQRRNPVGFFGMVLVLEGTSVEVATAAADSIESALDLPRSAFSYLRSHGTLDQQHMANFESLVNRLGAEEDRGAIRDTARVMYRLYGDVFRSLPVDREREAA